MRLLVAGGGTGGHLFPGLALAEEVKTRHPKNDVMFVGTSRGLESRVIPKAGFPLELIDVGPLWLLWVVPLYRIEADYAETHGWEAFETLLREADPDLLDPHRLPADGVH